MDQVLPFDGGFADRVRTIEDRAQPHILDEALWALFERDQKKDGEVDVAEQQGGLIFLMLWVAAEALDSAWRPPTDIAERIANAPEFVPPADEDGEE